ncbi:DUF4365 domain-containing protein [Nitrospira sp. Ecomares 2.1]
MPKHPRPHKLEEESRSEFRRKLLPLGWIFRDTTPDYGIDGEVEIFEMDSSTGLIFKVQLKATDKLNLKKNFALTFKRETLQYFLEFKIPVLIVHYHSHTNKFHAKWAHTYDSYFEKRDSKTISFPFSSEDEWISETPERLVEELKAIRNLSSPQPNLPFSFALIIEGQTIHGIQASLLTSEIRKLIARLPDFIEINPIQYKQVHTFIRISNEETVIKLAGKIFFSFHTNEGISPETALKKFPFDVLLGAGIAINEAGHSNVAARLIEEYATRSSIIDFPQTLGVITRCLLVANRVAEALQIAEWIFDKEETQDMGQILMIPTILRKNSLSSKEGEFYRNFLERRVEKAKKHQNAQNIAVAHYNLGNYLRYIKPRLALFHYREAARHDPLYCGRSYYLSEMGGILFGAGRYRLAARFYGEAVKLGEEAECHALFADALLFAGQYKDAQESLEIYLAQTPEPKSEWKLKKWLLDGLRPTLGMDQQKRETAGAINAIQGSKSHSLEKNLEKCLEALSLDGLCPAAWRILGDQKLAAGDLEGASLAWLISAVINKHHLSSWVFYISAALGSKSKSFLTDAIRVAYQTHGEDFFQALIEILKLDSNFPLDKFVGDAYIAVSDLLERNHVNEFRCFFEGNNPIVFCFKNSRLEELKIPISGSQSRMLFQ